MAGGAVPTSLFKLLFHKGAAQATPQANQLRTVGSIVEANNCKGRPGWHRCTVVSCEKVVHNPNVMVRFDDDELVKTYTYRMRPLLPLQHAIRALVAVDLLPAELDNHCRLKQMKDAWLETRGLELRGALSEEQAHDRGCNPMQQRLQPYATEAATLCNRGCNHMQPYATEAATLCDRAPSPPGRRSGRSASSMPSPPTLSCVSTAATSPSRYSATRLMLDVRPQPPQARRRRPGAAAACSRRPLRCTTTAACR